MSYAQPNAITTMIDFAAQWDQLHPSTPIGIGEMGGLGGKGDFTRHPGNGHAGGNIIDIRPMTINGNASKIPWFPAFVNVDAGRVGYKEPSRYSRSLTQDLVDGLWQTGQVKGTLFNDPKLMSGHIS